MPEQGFQTFSRTELDAQLATILRHWDATPLERAVFVSWAWVVAAASDLSAAESPLVTAIQLQRERDTLHQELTEVLLTTSVVDLELVSKRMFLDWLQERMGDARAAA
jgi:hypothetical protein